MPTAVTSGPFTALKDSALFTPLKIGKIGLEHRIVQVSFTTFAYGSPMLIAIVGPIDTHESGEGRLRCSCSG